MEYVNQLSTQLMTGEEEMETEEKLKARLAKKEDEDDWAYDEFIGN